MQSVNFSKICRFFKEKKYKINFCQQHAVESGNLEGMRPVSQASQAGGH
jgi:hypothetical protein